MRRSLKRSLRRAAVIGLLLPCLYFGTASAMYLLRVRSENAQPASARLPAVEALTADHRYVIFSPHPDDETLGCAGLIQQAIAAGAPVTVAFLTNGDGFRVAVERQFRELRIGPEHYVRFAALRQQETYKALQNLGVQRSQILFLDYPDRGLLPLWTDNWSPDHPFRSPYTQQDHSPYPVAFHPGAAYSGQSLLADLERVLEEKRPTDVFVTHPSDDHPDHTAASSFVTLALQQLRDRGETWARECRIRYYIVHRGDWPVPQGLYKTDPLTPPAEMASLDTKWSTLPLTPEQTETKSRSILDYASQTAVTKRFLVSFARDSEVFGRLDAAEVARLPEGSRPDGGLLRDWSRFTPVVRDPVNDSLLRDFQGGGDIRSVYAVRDASRLYLRVETYQPVSSRMEFRVRFRYFGDPAGAAGGSYLVSARPNAGVVPAEIPCATHGSAVDLSVPLRELGYAHRLALDIDTLFAGLQVDRTGYRFLNL